MGDWRPFVYGGLASVTAEFGTFPIDLTKSRLQVQGQVTDASLRTLKYRGMLHTLSTIVKEEGPRALYSGLSPAVLRQATYGTIKIGIYHTMKRAIVKDPKDETLFYNVICGATAGVISSSIANPTDVLKVRMQVNKKQTSQTGMWASFADIYKLEGLRGLWRGVGPTAQRAAVVCGVELPVYDVIKKYIIKSGYLGDTKETHFISSFLAGFAGAIASNPIDVCKTRMMNQKRFILEPTTTTAAAAVDATTGSAASAATAAQRPVIYKSAMDCLIQTVKTEGFMALYKGFIPNWFRLGPWNIIFFMTYEQLKKVH